MQLVQKVAPATNDDAMWFRSHLYRVKETIAHLYDVFDGLTAGPRSPSIDPEMVKAALSVIEYHLDGVMERWAEPTESSAEVSPSKFTQPQAGEKP